MRKHKYIYGVTGVVLLAIVLGVAHIFRGDKLNNGLPVTGSVAADSHSVQESATGSTVESPNLKSTAVSLDAPNAAHLAAKTGGGKKRPPPPPPPPSTYPVHTSITATVFWVGEPVGGGSTENNAISAWDDAWQERYGGYDDPVNRNGYYPVGFTPKENPFYLDLPYNDFNNDGTRKANAYLVVPWAKEKVWPDNESMMKNRWVKIVRNGRTCYGQIEDAGPYQYDDYAYVFGTSTPKNTWANNAGMDVSPALRDCLGFIGINNDENKVDWQFVNAVEVPAGPWKEIVTTSLIYWP